jgi:dihydroorotate dehydrogenase (NAD+) catalytic subunit
MSLPLFPKRKRLPCATALSMPYSCVVLRKKPVANSLFPRSLCTWKHASIFTSGTSMPKYDLSLNTALMNAFLTFPGGFLMHTGHPNPGLNKVIRRYASHWRRSPLPIIVHMLGDNASEIANMLARLESIEGVMGIEIGVPPHADRGLLISLVEAATGELPVIVRLPLDRSIDLAPYLRNSAIAAISLGPPRGALPGPDASLIHGRLYGPAIFPLAVAAVKIIHAVGVPVIGAGGVYKPQDAELMLSTGAIAVQLDSVLWRGDYG